jgi:hypothetical protein
MTVKNKKTKYWYNSERQLHRDDGPAVVTGINSKYWYKDGKRHREDGPAVEMVNGHKEYWLNGKFYSEIEFRSLIKTDDNKVQKEFDKIEQLMELESQ